jgi:hypothetical protein
LLCGGLCRGAAVILIDHKCPFAAIDREQVAASLRATASVARLQLPLFASLS